VSLPDPAAVKAALERERAKYPAVMAINDMALMLNAVALQFPSVGMHRKPPSDTSATLPSGITINRNVLRYLPPGDSFGWWADVLGAAGTGAAIPLAPAWVPSTDDRASFVWPVGVVQPPRPPEQPPASDLAARVAALERSVAEQAATVKLGLDAAAARLEVLERGSGDGGLDAAAVRALIVDVLSRARVEGKTERDVLGLQHQVRLGVTVK